MRYFIASIVFIALALAGCTNKKADLETPAVQETPLLDQICDIELERHGDSSMDRVDLYGNQAMDEYLANPGRPEVLERRMFQSSGVCRGALMQLLLQGHRQYMLKEWPRLLGELEHQDKAALLRAIGNLPVKGLDELVLSMLDQDQTNPTRRAAAIAVAQIDQARYWKTIREIYRRERNIAVLKALILSTDLAKAPRLGESMTDLEQVHDPNIHRTVFIALASSDLKNKANLLAKYLDHPDDGVRASAQAFLNSLEDKEKMELEVSIAGIGTQSAEDKIDTDLVEALKRRKIYRVRQLVRGGASLEARDDKGNTPLHLAIRTMHEDLVRELVLSGANPNARNKDGQTPLHFAAMFGHHKIVRVLLALGADTGIADGQGQTPKDVAKLLENPKVLASIHGQSQEISDTGTDALIAAVKTNRYREVVNLLEAGADPNVRNEDGDTPLTIAAKNNQLPIVERLLKAGASLYARDARGMTAEAIALAEGHTSMARYFKNRINADSLRTAIIAALKDNDREKVEELLDQGADVGTEDDDGDPLLLNALIYGDKDMVELLVLRRADIYIRDGKNRTLVELARILGKQDIVEYLEAIMKDAAKRE